MSDLDVSRAHLLALCATEATKRAAIVAIFATLAPAIVEWSDAAAACGPAKAVYDSLGGSHLQPFAPLAETLRAAQREPGKYGDLVVRVWGMSARFVELCKGYQEDVIARTQHGV